MAAFDPEQTLTLARKRAAQTCSKPEVTIQLVSTFAGGADMTEAGLRHLFRKAYEEVGFKMQEDVNGPAGPITFSIEGVRGSIKLLTADLDAYQAHYEELEKCHIGSDLTSLLTAHYREQRITAPISSPEFMFGDGKLSGLPYVEISPASELYRLKALLQPGLISYFRQRLEKFSRFNYKSFMDRIVTVKVGNVPVDDLGRLEFTTTEMIHSALFQLSFSRDANLGLSTAWPTASVLAEDDHEEGAISLPFQPVIYATDLTRFYRHGASDADPFVQFLSYYHVLEYFFLRVSDAALYKRMSSTLSDPGFRPEPKFLDRLIVAVSSHRSETDETEMLKLVLKEYVSEDELIAFLSKSDIKPAYSSPKECFGYTLDKVALEKQHVIGGIAKRLKTIRNALVHSSDKYERRERYVPGAKANKCLRPEIPLMRYLAGVVVVGSAKSRTFG